MATFLRECYGTPRGWHGGAIACLVAAAIAYAGAPAYGPMLVVSAGIDLLAAGYIATVRWVCA